MKIRYTSVIALFLLTFTNVTPALAATSTKGTLTSAATKSIAVASDSVATRAEVEKRVREYFKDAPNMIEIARCESNFRQFTDAGNVLRGGMGGQMVGVYQFYESVHSRAAKGLGFDISSLDGNLAYARHVYEAQGTTPWSSGQSCWSNPLPAKNTALTVSAAKPDPAKLQEQIRILTQLIALLQQQLTAMKK